MTFRARLVEESSLTGRPAVVTEVEGNVHITGTHEFVLDPHDELGTGLLLR